MEESNTKEVENSSQSFNPAVLSIVVLVIFLLLIGGVYMYVANKSKGQMVFPAGVNYISPNNGAAVDSAHWTSFGLSIRTIMANFGSSIGPNPANEPIVIVSSYPVPSFFAT